MVTVLVILAAGLAVCGDAGGERRDAACVAGLGVVPLSGDAGRGVLEGLVRGARSVQTVGLVERLADFGAEQGAPAPSCDELPGAAAEGAAAARATDFLVAAVRGDARGEGEQDKLEMIRPKG